MSIPRRYTRMRTALNTPEFTPLASGHRRAVCGDIICCQPPNQIDPVGSIGKAEAHTLLWLYLEGLEDQEMQLLASRDWEPYLTGDEPTIKFDKRRYCIPFRRLKKMYPAFDINRAKDPSDPYQPFVFIPDDPPYYFQSRPIVFQVQGLVFDKATGRFL